MMIVLLRMADSILREIGSRMRDLRLGLRLTQAEVAEQAGIESSFYGQVERGRNTPSVRTLLAVAAALKVAPAELLPEPGDPPDRRYASAIEGMLAELSERDRRLVLGLVRDLAARLKK